LRRIGRRIIMCMLLIAAFARWALTHPLQLVWFSPHLVIDPEQSWFKRLLREGRLLSCGQTEDHAAADKGQANDYQCDAQNGHFTSLETHFRPLCKAKLERKIAAPRPPSGGFFV
jgi:hypothetical protein